MFLRAAEGLSLDPSTCSPARIALTCQRLMYGLASKSANELSTIYGSVASALAEEAKAQLLPFYEESLLRLRSRVASGHYDRMALHSVFSDDFPARQFLIERLNMRSASAENVMTQLLGQRIFNGVPAHIAQPDGSWPFVPTSLIETLGMIPLLPDRPDKTLIDLGAGPGSVAIPVAMFTPMQVIAVEKEDRWVAMGEEARAMCNVNNLSFQCDDVLQVDLRKGDVFFVYSPFDDSALIGELVKRLDSEAQARPITVWCHFSDFVQAMVQSKNFIQIQGHGALKRFESRIVERDRSAERELLRRLT